MYIDHCNTITIIVSLISWYYYADFNAKKYDWLFQFFFFSEMLQNYRLLSGTNIWTKFPRTKRWRWTSSKTNSCIVESLDSPEQRYGKLGRLKKSFMQFKHDSEATLQYNYRKIRKFLITVSYRVLPFFHFYVGRQAQICNLHSILTNLKPTPQAVPIGFLGRP